MTTRYHILLLSISVIIQNICFSQAHANDSKFRLLSAIGSYRDLKYELKANGEITNVTLNQSLSKLYTRPTGSLLELFREIPPPSDTPDAKPTRQIVVSATFPSTKSNCIIITRPEFGTSILNSFVVEDSEDHHAGTFKVINISNFPVGIAVNEQQYSFPPQSVNIISTGASNRSILLQVAIQNGRGWTSILKQEHRLVPQIRGFVLINNFMQDPDYDPTDFPPPALGSVFFEVSPEILAKAQRN